MRGLPRPTKRTGRIAALTAGSLVIVPLLGMSASADSSGTVTPFVDCVTTNPTTGEITAYFGYSNTLPNQMVIAVGDNNQFFPADAFQGQPNYFDIGDYPRVVAVDFDPVIFPSIAWVLDGAEADASAASPACASGVTTPADQVGATTATLTGVVVPDGVDTTYHFEWGLTASLGQNTPVGDGGSGGPARLVQTGLTGLAPNTQYYYRLDENSGFAPDQGQILSFTTTSAPPLALTTVTLPEGSVGAGYAATLAATGGIGPYTWSITAGALPPGLSLNAATGAITGTPTAKTSAKFTVTVTDSNPQGKVTVTGRFEIRIEKAAKTAGTAKPVS
jgi:Putative Ig domain